MTRWMIYVKRTQIPPPLYSAAVCARPSADSSKNKFHCSWLFPRLMYKREKQYEEIAGGDFYTLLPF